MATTGIWTALELMGVPHIHVVLTGGFAREQTGSLTGPAAERVLPDFNFSKAFFGAWGVTPDDGLTDVNLTEVEVKRSTMDRAQTVVAIVDGSRFGRLGLASFAPTAKIDTLITDDSASSVMVDELRQRGVEVIINAGKNQKTTGPVA